MTELPCPPQMWPRFSTLLDELLDLPEPDRAGFLSRLDGEDTPVKPWLERVLASSTGPRATADFMAPPRFPSAFEDDFRAGTEVGPYRLEERLGAGGMGVVWRASRQDDGPNRQVALKLPHADLLSGPVRQRFRRERDMLAGLSHPHIAMLFDAGLTLHGHPYMALELITGTPITAYCQATAASLQRRMELLEQVLDALSYAHQRLIVHRDIKPTNVLVTAEGQVKLLDFGIAKLLRGGATADMMMTQAVSRLATPGYGAPEQMAGDEITVAADLFSVGVLGFELCTGELPFATVPLSTDAAEAPLASRRAAASADPQIRRLAPGLRGDLDAILAKALSLDPVRRYISADAFKRDLRRWREGLPVSARRVGWGTLARKFVRRNPVGVVLGLALVLAVAAGTTGVYWQSRRAAEAAIRATTIKDFMVGLFTVGDPKSGVTPSETMTAKELLDIGSDRAADAFKNDPATEIALLETLGDVYDDLSDDKRALQVRGRQLELAKTLSGPNSSEVIQDTLRLANSEVFFQNEDQAKALLESVRKPVFTQYGDHSLERANWLFVHALSLRATPGGREQALADCQAAVDILEKYFPDAAQLSEALNELSGFQYDSEQMAASLETNERARNVAIRQNAFASMDNLMYLSERGTRLERLGRFEAAEQSFLEEAALARKTVAADNTFYVHAQNALANLLHVHGERVRADAIFAAVLAPSTGHAASTGGATSVRRAYGAALLREGRPADALPWLEQALAETRRHPRDAANIWRTEGYMGDCYDQLGRSAEARTLLAAAREGWMRYSVPGGQQTLLARQRWADFLARRGDTVAAAAEFQAVLKLAGTTPGAGAAMAQAGLARLALAGGDLAAADHESDAALRCLDATTVEYDRRDYIDIWLTRAAVLRARGDNPAALALARKALDGAHEWDAPQAPAITRIQAFLDAGKPD